MTVEAHGQLVEIEVRELRNKSGVPSFKVVAKHGATKVELSGTAAPVDAESMPEPGHVRRAIEELGERAAHQAVVREELRLQLQEAV